MKNTIRTEIRRRYLQETNMTVPELLRWKKNRLSKKASLTRKPINLAIHLKSTKPGDWMAKELRGALKAISYLRRAKKIKGGVRVPGTTYTRNEIALKNWGYDKKKERFK